MNAATKIVLLLVAAAIAAVAYLMLTREGDTGPAPITIDRPDTANPPPDEIDPVTPDPTERSEPVIPDPSAGNRTEVDPGAGDSSTFAQGLQGRTVDQNGVPLPGVTIALRKVVPGGIFGPILRQQQGIGNAPLATAASDQFGAFQVGLRKVEEGALELCFIGPASVDKSVKGMAIEPGQWKDVGNIQLDRGCVLFGRVSDAQSGGPVVGATVYANNPIASGMSPAPGREIGVPTQTDLNGNYRFENIAAGAVQVQIHAEGYARLSDHEIRVSEEGPTQKDFLLPIGMNIEGVVTDAEGNGIAGVEVSAVCLSTKSPMKVDVRTDGDGFFLVEGLVDAPFQLNAMAAGFLRATVQPVQAGETEQHIVLERQGGARVRVVGSDGRLLKNYSVMMLRYFEKNDQYGAAHDIPMRQVRPRDLDNEGAFELTGLNPGDYAFEIYAGSFAKTRSEPFKVAANVPPTTVTVTMRAGGKIEGVVMGPNGSPLAGVEVETVPPNLIEVPFLRDLQHLMTTEITRKKTTTGADGSYRLDTLAPATYKLKFTHRDAYVKYVEDVVVGDEQTTGVETVKLERGTRVHGIVRVDGQVEAGIKVSITSTPQPGAQGLAQIRFSEEAVTNEHGEFEFPRRIPPGNYTLRAGRQQGNPLLVMLDYKKTEQEIAFANQDSFEYSPNIVSN